MSVADTCSVICSKTRIKVILQYLEDAWVGRGQNRVEGAIFRFDPNEDTISKLRDVPNDDVVARIEGVWTDKIYYTLGGQRFDKSVSEFSISKLKDSLGRKTNKIWPLLSNMHNMQDRKHLLVDLNPLFPVSKGIPPIESQLANESRRFWESVTSAIANKQYSHATGIKQQIEERQRVKAAKLKDEDREWKPRFFAGVVTPDGKPDLTEDGKQTLKRLLEGDYHLEENEEF